MGMKYLVLWFEGPFQAWGTDSKFNSRSTQAYPSKSGVLGMILAAAGLSGEQSELLASLSACNQSCYIIREGKILVDFQTVGNGYDTKDSWQKKMIPKKRDGGTATKGGSKILYKQYIQDGIFAVIQEIPEELEEVIEPAMKNPVWPLYLGRKNCIPTEKVYNGLFDSFDDAKRKLKEIISSREGLSIRRTIIEGERPEAGDVYSVCDVPLSFGVKKRYASRFITIHDGELE